MIYYKINMKRFFAQIIGAIIGLWIAYNFIDNVFFTGSYFDLVFIGFILAILNIFIKPILSFFALPLRILTLGLFSIIINMIIIWSIDYLFIQLTITSIFALLLTSVIISICTGFFSFKVKK